MLELDHVHPVARGGASTVENLQLRCRGHNVLEAERVFGRAHMARFGSRTGELAHPGDSAPSVNVADVG